LKKWTFKPVGRDTPNLFPAAVQDYLPEEHLARFVVVVVDQLDVDAFVKAYRGVGSKAWHPSMMLALLLLQQNAGHYLPRLDLRVPVVRDIRAMFNAPFLDEARRLLGLFVTSPRAHSTNPSRIRTG